VKRGIMVAVAGAAIVVAGLAGCSSNKSSTARSSSPSVAASGTISGGSPGTGSSRVAAGGAGASQAKVVIDGQDQNATGQVVCTKAAGNVNIAIGQAGSGYTVVVTDANPAEVHSVALGSLKGVALAYQQGISQGDAEATKTGNAFQITGSATGMDSSQGMQMVTKPFEIDVTCP
jgi:ipoprotein LpqH